MPAASRGRPAITWSKALQPANRTPAPRQLQERFYNPTVYALNGQASIGTLRDGYGATAFDTRNNFVGDLIYSTPTLNNAVMKRTLSGWKVGGKIYLYSGDAPSPSSIAGSAPRTCFRVHSLERSLADTVVPTVVGTHCGTSAVHTPCPDDQRLRDSLNADGLG